MKIKEKDIKKFLQMAGWASASREKLAVDASFRSYERLCKENTGAILMLAPPKKEDTAPFIALDKYLVSNGYSAPAIKAMDTKTGLLILEDFGDKLLKNLLLECNEREVEYYTLAVELLISLHQKEPPKELPSSGSQVHQLPIYNADLLQSEAALFNDWYLNEGLGLKKDQFAQDLNTAWQNAFKHLSSPSVLTLRDYHAENLMVLLERKHIKKIGLLDFQDAAIGHRAYDLVSLLQDARRFVSADLEKKMIEHYLKTMEQKGYSINKAIFRQEYSIIGAQRSAKVIGIFTRLWKRDKKKSYTKLIPHVWEMLEKNLSHPNLKPVKDIFDKAVPKEQRKQPMKGA